MMANVSLILCACWLFISYNVHSICISIRLVCIYCRNVCNLYGVHYCVPTGGTYIVNVNTTGFGKQFQEFRTLMYSMDFQVQAANFNFKVFKNCINLPNK